uniref:Uncharacterized protein n=1 Tax=Tanacetum cinerariifolium TaxID=118510 RepID=A0A6L2LN67_TANCI|nr:hypothetical protein [Tanacetum cinerariifolium]
MRYQALKRKPMTEAQARKNMMIYLKIMARLKMDFFKGMTYNEIRPIFEKHYNSIQAFLKKKDEEVTVQEKRQGEHLEQDTAKKQRIDEEAEELKTHLQIVFNDDDVYIEVIPLALKVPVVDYQIHHEHNKPYYNIIRADGTHQLFLSFITLLKNFNREDLEALGKLVKERFESVEPKNFSDDFLLNTLKIMFEKPNVKASVWRDQKGRYGLEKKYPLTHFTLEQILNNVRLEVEKESEMSLELLSFGVDAVQDFKKMHQGITTAGGRSVISKPLSVIYIPSIALVTLSLSHNRPKPSTLIELCSSHQSPMANLEFCDKHNTVAFLQKPQGSENFHQIVDFLTASHIRNTAKCKVDGQVKTITEASVRRHLKLADADGISSLPTTEIFKQLALMGTRTKRMGIRIPQFNVPSSAADEAITKEMHDGLGRATTTSSSLASEQGSGNISKTQTKATPSGLSFPRTSSEGGLGCLFTMGIVLFRIGLKGCLTCPMNDLLEKNELTIIKVVYNKALITFTKRVKKLEKQLKHKGRRAVINSSDDAEPSLDAEDSPKQERMIEELDTDENVNLVQSSEQGENAAKDKGKGIMQESKLPKKIKESKRIQLSLDENLAQKLYAEELAKETSRQEQEKPFSKAKVRKNMCTYLKNQEGYKQSYFKGLRSGFDLQPECSKKQKLDEQAEVQVDSDPEEDEIKKYMKIVLGEEIAIDAIPLATKPPVIVE